MIDALRDDGRTCFGHQDVSKEAKKAQNSHLHCNSRNIGSCMRRNWIQNVHFARQRRDVTNIQGQYKRCKIDACSGIQCARETRKRAEPISGD